MKSPSYCLVACLALSIVYALPLFGVPQKTKKETVWRTICLDGIDCSYQVAIFRTPSQTEVRNWVDKVAPPPHKKIKGLVRIASSQYLEEVKKRQADFLVSLEDFREELVPIYIDMVEHGISLAPLEVACRPYRDLLTFEGWKKMSSISIDVRMSALADVSCAVKALRSIQENFQLNRERWAKEDFNDWELAHPEVARTNREKRMAKRVEMAECQAANAMIRAAEASSAAEEAQRRADSAESRASWAECDAAEANRRAVQAENRARQAESRAWQLQCERGW